MNLYYAVLKAFLKTDIYNKYKIAIDDQALKEDQPELYKLFLCLEHLHKTDQQQFSLTDLELTLKTLYPKSDELSYNFKLRNWLSTFKEYKLNHLHYKLQEKPWPWQMELAIGMKFST